MDETAPQTLLEIFGDADRNGVVVDMRYVVAT